MQTKSRKLLSTLLAVAMVFGLFAAMPLTASAAGHSDTEIDISILNGGGDQTFVNWSYDETSKTITVTGDVDVIGTVSGVTDTLTIDIVAGKTVTWKAQFTATPTLGLTAILFDGAGAFCVDSGWIRSNKIGILSEDGGNIAISGGEVSTITGIAIEASEVYCDGTATVTSGGTAITSSVANSKLEATAGTLNITGAVEFADADSYVVADNNSIVNISGNVSFMDIGGIDALNASTVNIGGNVVFANALSTMYSEDGSEIYIAGSLTSGISIFIDSDTFVYGTTPPTTANVIFNGCYWDVYTKAPAIPQSYVYINKGVATAPTITTTSPLPGGVVGTVYSQTLAATGDTPFTWALDSGSLPAGLSLSPAGVISGTPTAAGTSNFTVKATNSAGDATKAFALTVNPAQNNNNNNNNNNNSGKSSGGGGGGGGGGASVAGTPAITWMTASGATGASKSSGQYGVRGGAWAKLAGKPYRHDTISGNAVDVRVTVNNPEKLTKDTLVSGYVKGPEADRVKGMFEKRFKNKLRVIHFDQQGAWGQPVEIAAKVDLAGMDTTKLCFYYYDREKNSYALLNPQPKYSIDKNGYLHFTTEYAGDIIISEGLLKKK